MPSQDPAAHPHPPDPHPTEPDVPAPDQQHPEPPPTPDAVLVVDVANVMGSRPDGWWRDRAAAATRWLADLNGLVGREVPLPDGGTARLDPVLAVVEGRARQAVDPVPAAVRVVRAERDGDSTVVAVTEQVRSGDAVVVVVTADRGLRDRLPPGVLVTGPGWLRRLLEEGSGTR